VGLLTPDTLESFIVVQQRSDQTTQAAVLALPPGELLRVQRT
jgi:hypothetical protein